MKTCRNGHPKTGPGACKICVLASGRRNQLRAKEKDRARLGPTYPGVVPALARQVWRA